MRIGLPHLAAALQVTLAPVYCVSGDEPWQLGEALEVIRRTARERGFLSREVFQVDSQFAWSVLYETAHTGSLFGDKQIIELHVADAKLEAEGIKTLQAYCAKPADATLLLLSMPKLSPATLKTPWFTALDKCGVSIAVWPLETVEFMQWLQRRAGQRGIQLTEEAAKQLANKTKGNLLASAQEIEKLSILYGQQSITASDIDAIVANNARYDVFKLTDALLSGQTARALKIVYGLQSEAVAPAIVLWGLAREIRLLFSLHTQLRQGVSKEQAFRNQQVWDKRKTLVSQALAKLQPQQLLDALRLSASADQQIKGQHSGDPWETIVQLCVRLTDVTLPTA